MAGMSVSSINRWHSESVPFSSFRPGTIVAKIQSFQLKRDFMGPTDARARKRDEQ